MRWACCVEYDGSAYHGWQEQPHAANVQHAVEAALSRVADVPIKVVCSGRTDAGVHALGQVVHFDTEAQRPDQAWVFGANRYLPDTVSLRWARPVSEDFHARYDAVSRLYRYLILNHPARSALFGRRAWRIGPRLDVPAMQAAVPPLIGEHDFSAFRAAGCQSNSPMRNLHAVDVRQTGDFVVLDVRANAFLHHMVRNIAGTLAVVGRGEQQPDWVGRVLAARDRTAAGMTAPAHGLYFVGPQYPARFGLPERPDPALLMPEEGG